MGRFFLLLFLAFSTNFVTASEFCEERNSDRFRDLVYSEGEMHIWMYGSVPKLLSLKESDDKASVLRKLKAEEGSNLWALIVGCNDDQTIFFSLSSAGSINEYFNGVIVLKNSRYFAGPLSLLPKNKVIIQADKL